MHSTHFVQFDKPLFFLLLNRSPVVFFTDLCIHSMVELSLCRGEPEWPGGSRHPAGRSGALIAESD